MKAKPKLSKGIDPLLWLQSKPYRTLSAWYDPYYVKLCNAVLEILNEHEEWFDDIDFDLDERKGLACVLVSYFEDFTNEIGIWRAFTKHNEKNLGFAMPFYDLSDYDPDYLNVQDIAYLIWHRRAKYYPNSVSAPDQSYIIQIAEDCMDIFEEAIEDAPATSFYEEFFHIEPTDHFFDIKTKLDWFAFSSYTMGPDFTQEYKEQETEAMKSTKLEQYALIPKVLYQIKASYIHTKRSSFAALTAGEWFAEVITASEECKQDIRGMKYRYEGRYLLVDDSDETNYTFQHCYTGRKYLVPKYSFEDTKALEQLGKAKEALVMGLVYWNKSWWMSGMMYNLPWNETEKNKYMKEQMSTPWILDEKELTSLHEIDNKMYEAFIRTNGSPLGIYHSEKEANQAMESYMEAYAQSIEQMEEWERRRQERKNMVLHPELTKGATDIDMFYIKGEGLYTMTNLQSECIDKLLAESVSDQELFGLFEVLGVSLNPDVGQYILQTYPTRNIRFPESYSTMDLVQNLPYFWRFFSPEEFAPKFPRIQTVV